MNPKNPNSTLVPDASQMYTTITGGFSQGYVPPQVNQVHMGSGGSGGYISGSLELNNIKEILHEVSKRMCTIEDRLAILKPDKVLLNKHPQLQDAYNHYKLMEQLLSESVDK
jgi:hypothetical protein